MKSSLILPTFALVAGAFTAGCTTSAVLNKISIGMPKAEVITLLGNPSSMSAQANIEYLTYYLTADDGYGRDEPYMVRIVDGKVESFGRFRQLYDLQNRPINTAGPSVPPATVIQTTSSAPAASDIASQLQRLKTMHDQGVLSDDEFAKAKAKVLATGN